MHSLKHSSAYSVQQENDVDVECRHDMRPSVQLPSAAGVDSTIGHAQLAIKQDNYDIEIF